MKKNILITGGNGFIGAKIRGGTRFNGRIENDESVFRAMEGMAGVVHLAANSNWRDCEEDPRDCITTNLIGLINVLDAAIIRGSWVLFASTFQNKDKKLYGMTKLLGEELCRIYSRLGLKVWILRLPVVYGPGDKAYKIVNRLIAEIKAGVKPRVKTNIKFPCVYVNDMARLIEREVDVISGLPARKITLRDLISGIRKCLK
jgi:nucleoside-diphosphate-sugar epimerase